MRKDFVRGVLTSDILGYRISTHILREEYAARVRTPRLYAAISRDLISRWMFPIVPESNLLEDQPLTFRRGYQYIGQDDVFSRTADIGENVVIGGSVTVGEGSVVKNSVIGPYCQIGADVVLDGAFLGEGCVIEAGCKILHSLLAENVLVKIGSIIESGCMVTSNVTLGPRASLPPHTRVAKLTEHVDVQMNNLGLGSDSDPIDLNVLSTSPMSPAERLRVLGRESDGVVWEGPIEEESEETESETDDDELVEERRRAFALDSTFKPDRHKYEETDEESSPSEVEDSLNEDFEDVDSEMHEFENDDHAMSDVGASQSRSQFMQEAEEMLRHAVDSCYSVDNAALELNGLKFACNASFRDCQIAILHALFSRSDPNDLAKSFTRLWTTWGPLLAKFTHGHQEELDLISVVCSLCRTYNRAGEVAPFERAFNICIPLLYKTDVLEDDSILEWYEKECTLHGEDNLYCRQIKSFVNWLEASSDEDSEEESDGSSDSD